MDALSRTIHSNVGIVKPLDKNATQTFYGRRIQLFQLLVGVLEQTGPADITITTFSSSDEFLRRLLLLRRMHQVTTATLLTDSKALKKTLQLAHLICNCYEHVYIGDNHSKVVLIENPQHHINIITSQNQTRGNRLECSVVSNDPTQYEQLRENIDAACASSRNITELIGRRASRS